MSDSVGAIGIDLGTRNALCAFIGEDSRPVMIPNRWGRTTTPSVVGWNDGWLVGEDAVRRSLQCPIPVWWDLKRKVGDGFRASCGGRTYAAQDVLVPLIRALREDAEVFMGRFVSSCVLTVPACFSLAQREAMVKAAGAAGLREARIVNEPTAAALAFGRDGRFLIVDFGAGTVDISAAESEDGVWQVLESVGSARIGGYDFDIAMAEWLRERLNLPPMSMDDPAWRVLVLEAENIKIALSSCHVYEWNPPPLPGVEYLRTCSPVRIEREDFERMVRFSIRRIMHAVRRMWERYEPEHLLLVGGSSRIPLLHDILEREIVRPERLRLCAEESVAAGAALYAEAGGDRLLLDVLSGDVGFVADGESRIIAMAGTPLPLTTRLRFAPESSGPTEMVFFQNMNDIPSDAMERPSGQTALAVLNIDAVAGMDVSLRCSVTNAGLMRLTLRHNGATIEASLTGRVGQTDQPAGSPADRKRLRDLKLRLVPMEMALSDEQRERLYALLHRIDGMNGGTDAVAVLERLVRDLEIALT